MLFYAFIHEYLHMEADIDTCQCVFILSKMPNKVQASANFPDFKERSIFFYRGCQNSCNCIMFMKVL